MQNKQIPSEQEPKQIPSEQEPKQLPLEQEPKQKQTSIDHQLRADSFKQMKQWDDKKIHFLNFHNEVTSHIESKLMAIHSISTNANDRIIQFLNERVDLDKHYYKQQKTKICKLFNLFHWKSKKDLKNEQCKVVYPCFQDFLRQVDECSETKRQKSETFNYFIQNVIIKQANEEKKQYNKQTGEILKQITSSKKKLQIVIGQVNTISSNYTRHFFESATKEKKKTQKCDLYLEKIKLYAVDKQQIQLHNQIGNYVCDLWENLIQLETKRLDFYKKIFQDTVNQLKELQLNDLLTNPCQETLDKL